MSESTGSFLVSAYARMMKNQRVSAGFHFHVRKSAPEDEELLDETLTVRTEVEIQVDGSVAEFAGAI